VNNSLKRIREDRKMTLDELAQLSGYGKSTINNFENGKTGASEEFLKKMASVLKTSVAEILEDPAAPSLHESPPEYRINVRPEVMAVLDGGPALAATKMNDAQLVSAIKEHARSLALEPEYAVGPEAEIISALALELYARSKKKSEEES
jgi:transcriptional regulator with XRE-family HTH domain